MTSEALVFELEQIRFGIWSPAILQVLRAVAISALPDAPAWIEGIINLHGRVVPVLDLRRLLRLPAKEIEVSDHMIVLELVARQVAIRVDCAMDLIPLDVESLEETHVKLAGVEFRGTIGKTPLGLVHVLAADDLLSPIESAMLETGLAQRGEEPDDEDS